MGGLDNASEVTDFVDSGVEQTISGIFIEDSSSKSGHTTISNLLNSRLLKNTRNIVSAKRIPPERLHKPCVSTWGTTKRVDIRFEQFLIQLRDIIQLVQPILHTQVIISPPQSWLPERIMRIRHQSPTIQPIDIKEPLSHSLKRSCTIKSRNLLDWALGRLEKLLLRRQSTSRSLQIAMQPVPL